MRHQPIRSALVGAASALAAVALATAPALAETGDRAPRGNRPPHAGHDKDRTHQRGADAAPPASMPPPTADGSHSSAPTSGSAGGVVRRTDRPARSSSSDAGSPAAAPRRTQRSTAATAPVADATTRSSRPRVWPSVRARSSRPHGCDGTHHSDTGHGANTGGPYDNTCDGSASLNGNGGGEAVGRPCAGCVGNADDKNPFGQYPNGSDHNAGYECDRNHGIGRTNPAHTGCATATGDAGDDTTGADDTGDDSTGAGGTGDERTVPCRSGFMASDVDGNGTVDHRDCAVPGNGNGNGNGNGAGNGVAVGDGDGDADGVDNANGNRGAKGNPTVGEPAVIGVCSGGVMVADANGDGTIDGADCAAAGVGGAGSGGDGQPAVPVPVVLCPGGVMATDLDGDGTVGAGDCGVVLGDPGAGRGNDGGRAGADPDATAPVRALVCPGGVMVADRNGDGVLDVADCAGVVPPGTSGSPTATVLCGRGVMATDVNVDGVLDAADCAALRDARGEVGPTAGVDHDVRLLAVCAGGVMVDDVNGDGTVDADDCVAIGRTGSGDVPAVLGVGADAPRAALGTVTPGRATPGPGGVSVLGATFERDAVEVARPGAVADGRGGAVGSLARTGLPLVALAALGVLISTLGLGLRRV